MTAATVTGSRQTADQSNEMGYESAYRLLSSTTINTIYYYFVKVKRWQGPTKVHKTHITPTATKISKKSYILTVYSFK